MTRYCSRAVCSSAAVLCVVWAHSPASASSLFSFSSGSVTDQIATASRPGPTSGPNQNTETADDFVLTSATRITSGSFTGLIPQGVSPFDITSVVVKLYRTFPLDSNTGRAPQVPMRVNSPSDVAFASAESSASLSFSLAVLGNSFTVQNSVDAGIHPAPNQTTGGEGPFTGQEVQINFAPTSPFDLQAGRYFFVPQVELADRNQHFLWLSASNPSSPDLQSWIRNSELQPDWLRIGTDVIGSGAFNAAFTLSGTVTTVPLPAAAPMFGAALLALGAAGYAKRNTRSPMF